MMLLVGFKRCFCLTSLQFFCLITTSQAALPVWTFEPLTQTAITLTPNEEATIVYQLTNQSHKTHRLVLTPRQGVTQMTSPGNCANPFILSYQQSCLLTLTISGRALGDNIVGGPDVCQDGNPSQCYRPSKTHQLNVQRTGTSPPPGQASIAVTPPALQLYSNGQVGNLSVENTNSDTAAIAVTAMFSNTTLQGLVTVNNSTCSTISPGGQCLLGLSAAANTPSIPLTPFIVQGRNTQAVTESVAISRPFAYVVSTNDNIVQLCQLNVDGSFTTCQDSGIEGLRNPSTMVINQANTYAYIADYPSNLVYHIHLCTIDNQTGGLTNCSTTALDASLSNPSSITLNERLQKAYISNYNSSAITTCTINPDATLSNCTNNTSLDLRYPSGVTYNNNNQQLYIVNSQGGTTTAPVLNCSLDNNGNITTCLSTPTGSAGDISFTNNNTSAYITAVFTPIFRTQICSVLSDGTLSSCQDTATDSRGNYLASSNTIALNAANTKAYLTGGSNGLDVAIICDITPMTGALSNCSQISQTVIGTAASDYLLLAH